MADENLKKRNFIEISSSEGSGSGSRSGSGSGSVSEYEYDYSPPESDEDFSESTSDIDDDDGDDDDEDEDDDDDGGGGGDGARLIDSENEEEDECDEVEGDKYCVDKAGEESMCNKVIHMIHARRDLQELKLAECKSYLRQHGLRLSGTKEECIERIKEHWRLKSGNGEAYYPRSSFKIDCTGDVCKGDVVLFNQKVHHNSNMMSGRRKLGRRTVVGRIVSESYGAAKQQHTFTVEVLWSKGDKRLDPLTPLFVKGRNLYKMRTYRQRWKDEKERLNVLAEKHKRGAAARSIRSVRNAKAVVKEKKSSKKGPKRQKHSRHVETRGNTSRRKNHPNHHGQLSAKSKNEQPRPISKPFQTTSSWMQNSHTRHHQVPVFQSNRVGDFLCHPYNLPIRNPCHFQSNGFPRDQMHHFFPSHRGVLPYPENAFPNWKGFGRGGYMPSRSSHVPRKPAW